MKKFKNAEILQILDQFRALEKKESENPDGALILSASVAWKRRLNKRALSNIAEEIEGALDEVNAAYLDNEHSVPIPGGDTRNVKPQYQREFIEKKKAILKQESDIEIKTVELSELPEALSDLQLDTLEFMIKED